MTPFYRHPMRRLEETTTAAAASLRALPDAQLRAEREALRAECSGLVETGPASIMLALYDGETGRRQREGSRG